MRLDIERKRRLSGYPARIRQKFDELNAAWGYPLDNPARPQVTEELYDCLEVLSFDYPERFGPFVDFELAVERDAKVAREQSLDKAEGETRGRLITRFVHPGVSRRKRALAEIKRAREDEAARALEAMSSDRSDYRDVAMPDWYDIQDEEVLFSREPSPGPPERAPSPLPRPLSAAQSLINDSFPTPISLASSEESAHRDVEMSDHYEVGEEEEESTRQPLASLPETPKRTITPLPMAQPSPQTTPSKRTSHSLDDGSPSKRGRASPESTVRAPTTPGSTVRRGISSLAIRPDMPTTPSPVRRPRNEVNVEDVPMISPTRTTSSSSCLSKTVADPSNDRRDLTVYVVPRDGSKLLSGHNDILFHVQWELERMVARHKELAWSDFQAGDFTPLRQASAAVATPRIPAIIEAVVQRKLGTFPETPSTTSCGTDRQSRLLAEVDFEEQAIRDNVNEGLLSNNPFWAHGGKLCYTVAVQPLENEKKDLIKGVLIHRSTTSGRSSPAEADSSNTSDSPFALSKPADLNERLLFAMTLQPPAMTGKSFRLARRYGSRRVLNFKFKSPKKEDDRVQMYNLFAGRRFVLFGRVFRALWSPPDKDGVFAIEVGESIDDATRPPAGQQDPKMPSFLELLQIHNDLSLKPAQAVAKWAARPQLLFSDSQPTIKVDMSDIEVVEDIEVADLVHRATTEEILTDGCGLMSADIALKIGMRLDSGKGRPFVVQMRLGGSKGLLAIMSQEQEKLYPGKGIVLRQSMVKSLSKVVDPSSLVVDVLRHGGNILRTGTVIAAEAIICLVHQGVPACLIVELARNALDELRDELSTAQHEGETEVTARLRLGTNVYRRGALHLDHKKRQLELEGKSARVAGCDFASCGGDRTPGGTSSTGSDDMSASERYDIDPVSGQPGSLAESLWMALQSGFSPSTSTYVRRKLHYFAAMQVDKIVSEYRIPVERSISAFIVPDSLQILAPDEVFIAFSGEGPTDPTTGCKMSHIEGDVLLYRSPCKLPTDVRKFKAVFRHELCHLKDCIVMSASATQCKRSPASFLSGGDYDGDTATVIYDSRIVDPFQNANDDIAAAPDNFEQDNFQLVTGTELLSQLADADAETQIRGFQKHLLGSILDNKLTGSYSAFHDNAVYTLGFGHPETLRLARMFCSVLDARKSGLQAKKEILASDRRKYDGHLVWKLAKSGELKQDRSNGEREERSKQLKRPKKRLGDFIMDDLLETNSSHGAGIKRCFPLDAGDGYRPSVDYRDLSETFTSCVRRIDAYGPPLAAQQLKELRAHVGVCRELWTRYKVDLVNKEMPVRMQYLERLPAESPSEDDGPVTKRFARHERPRDTSDGPGRAAIRALAVVWHEEFPLDRAAAICDDENQLRRLKIGCAVAKAAPEKSPLMPFEMDFEITRQLKAEKKGRTATVLESSILAMKPAFKPVK